MFSKQCVIKLSQIKRVCQLILLQIDLHCYYTKLNLPLSLLDTFVTCYTTSKTYFEQHFEQDFAYYLYYINHFFHNAGLK